jgi:hypothetical protein
MQSFQQEVYAEKSEQYGAKTDYGKYCCPPAAPSGRQPQVQYGGINKPGNE